MHRRLGYGPPEDARRSACDACLHTIGYLQPRLFRPPGLIAGATDELPAPTARPHGRHEPPQLFDVAGQESPSLLLTV